MLPTGDGGGGGRAGHGRPQKGFLGGVRELWLLHAGRLDEAPAPLFIEATRLLGEHGRFLYRFSVTAGERELLTGRASVFLQYLDIPQ